MKILIISESWMQIILEKRLTDYISVTELMKLFQTNRIVRDFACSPGLLQAW